MASAILRGRLPERLRARLTGKTLCITFVALGELTKWTALRSWGPRKLADLAQWRSGIVLLPFDEAVSVTWGRLQARAQHRGAPADERLVDRGLLPGRPTAAGHVQRQGLRRLRRVRRTASLRRVVDSAKLG
ncbi:hypothetical protein AB0C15_06645 [Micromonospora sp. NPDC048835]|uniref:hypothetical protein n=1 Tax=Micromonospora sp. NPDC048835 TaxID=3155147 RepID=UPI0033F59561